MEPPTLITAKKRSTMYFQTYTQSLHGKNYRDMNMNELTPSPFPLPLAKGERIGEGDKSKAWLGAIKAFSISLVSILWLITLTPTFSNAAEEDQHIQTLENPLRLVEDRKTALDELSKNPPKEFELVLLRLLRNEKESIPFRGRVADGLLQLANREGFHERIFVLLERLVTDQNQRDIFLRGSCVRILIQMTNEKEKQKLLVTLLVLAQNRSEPQELRKIVIGHLNKAGFMPEQNIDWAQRIIQNKREETPVRTAALNFMETHQLEKLMMLLPLLISDQTEETNFRKIAILKAARFPSESFALKFQTLFVNQNESFEIRKLCLSVLMNYMPVKNPLGFLNLTLGKEKNTRMQAELRQAIVEWKEKK